MIQLEFELSGRLLKGHHSYKDDFTPVAFRADIMIQNIKKILYYYTDESGNFEGDSDGEAGEDEIPEKQKLNQKVLTTLQIHCKSPLEDFYMKHSG